MACERGLATCLLWPEGEFWSATDTVKAALEGRLLTLWISLSVQVGEIRQGGERSDVRRCGGTGGSWNRRFSRV